MKYFITGGTGTLGKALVAELLKMAETKQDDITIFSRGENAQCQMKKQYPDLRYFIGDIRDKSRVSECIPGHDVVFHCAALKHVDLCEEYVLEAIKTNVLGSVNIAEAAMRSGVRYCALSSTDKAVLPINAYGMSKGLAERYFYAYNLLQNKTIFSVFRWGNVVGSNGSAIQTFATNLQRGDTVNITDPRMTRFWIRIEDAAAYMVQNYHCAAIAEPMIPEMKASTVLAMVEAIAVVLGKRGSYRYQVTGIRPGEKIHECLYSSHDQCLRSDTHEHYSHSELIDLVKDVVGLTVVR